MNPWYLSVGVLLLAAVVVDLLWTTLWVEGGAGPITSRLMAGTWRATRRFGEVNSPIHTLTGPLVLTMGLSTWLVLLWAGWTFVIAAPEGAIVDTVDGGTISWSDRLYFTGYVMFTLGNGDFAPKEGVLQIVTVLATASGMLLVTTTVTYILSVLDAVTQKRAFASGVTGLGTRGETVVRAAWDGEGFRGLDLLLNAYVSQLNTLTANHKAYPVLHYFHSESREQAPVTSIAVLDDALTILRFGVPESVRPSDAVVSNARASVGSYLETLRDAFVRPADRAPPPPDLASLREAGVPTTDDDEFAAAIEQLDERRRTMLGLVESDARQWPSEGDESGKAKSVIGDDTRPRTDD